MLIERLHEHIIQELQQNARSEQVFVVMAIALNLLAAGVNSVLASVPDKPVTMAVLVITMALVATINFVAFQGLQKGRIAKTKLLQGLVKMYEENQVAQYYDQSLLQIYHARYASYLVGVIATGAASFIIPIVVLAFK